MLKQPFGEIIMNLKKWFLIIIVLCFTTSCVSNQQIWVKNSPEKMHFEGFSFISPNEKGWFYRKNERLEGGLVVHRNKAGVGKKFTDENYVIRAVIVPFPNFEKDEEFLKFVTEKLINNQYTPRHNMLERYQKLFQAEGKNCVLDYYRGIDSEAKKISTNTDLMILEVRSFICHHPSENASLYFSYSFRYYSENNEPNLKEKAIAVLKNIEYSEIKSEGMKRDYRGTVEEEYDDLINVLKHGLFTI
jgi:hypothetical protein